MKNENEEKNEGIFKEIGFRTKKEHKIEIYKPTRRLCSSRFYALDFILFSVLFFTAPPSNQSFLFLGRSFFDGDIVNIHINLILNLFTIESTKQINANKILFLHGSLQLYEIIPLD